MREMATEYNTKKQAPGKSPGARRRIRLWMTFMVLFIGWAGYTYVNQSGEIGSKSHLLAERTAIKSENEQALVQLKYELNRLKDPEYIGQMAMKKYGLYKPGEIPVRISGQNGEND